jgi:hypothetical protein
MTAAIARRARALLRRAGLLAGILALIAGILGMHVLAGSHNMPMAAAGSAAGIPHHAPVMLDGLPGQTTGPVSVPGASPVTASMSSCLDPCPAMTSMDQPCVRAPGNTTLDAPLPGTTAFVLRPGTGMEQHAAAYRYLSTGPSPGELCISRT